MVAFCIIVLAWSPEAAASYFENIQPPLLPFRDATYGACTYQLTVVNCAKALNKAISVSHTRSKKTGRETGKHKGVSGGVVERARVDPDLFFQGFLWHLDSPTRSRNFLL